MKSFLTLLVILAVSSSIIMLLKAVTPGCASNWTTVVGGTKFSLGLQSDGSLWAWGNNTNGQLGVGSTTNINTVTRVGTATWNAIAAGATHSLGIMTNGTLWSWGNNSAGQLGLGDTTNRNVLTQVGTDTNWSCVSGGISHTMGLRTTGTLWTCGDNTDGQLGNGNSNGTVLSLAQIGSATYIAIAAGQVWSVAIATNGTLWCMGDNANGQCGLGGGGSKITTPTQIGTLTTWTKIASNAVSFGIQSNGSLWAWGPNSNGTIGDGTITYRNAPVQIAAGSTWTSITVGSYQSIGIQTNGSLWVWGANNEYQLGDGTTTQSLSPENIMINTTNWLTVGAGSYSSFAITTSGIIYSWGANSGLMGGVGNSSTYLTTPSVCYSNQTCSSTSNTCGCPSGTYMYSNYTCSPCDPSCATCNGSSAATKCLTCPTTGTPKFVLVNTTCVSTCPTGTYDTGNNTCPSCDSTCPTCNGTAATNCLTCPTGQVLISTTSSCAASCPTNYFLNSGICFACSSNCSTCQTTSAKCTSCASGYYLNTLTTTCVPSCPNGTYLDSGSSSCKACDQNCTTCQGSSTNCTSCQTGFVVYAANAKCMVLCSSDVTWQSPSAVSCAYIGTCDVTCMTRRCLSGRGGQCTQCADPNATLSSGSCNCPNNYLMNSTTGLCYVNATAAVTSALNSTVSSLLSNSSSNASVTVTTSAFILTAKKVSSTNTTTNLSASTSDGSPPIVIALPSLATITTQTNVVATVSVYTSNPYAASNTSANISSSVITINLLTSSGSPITVSDLAKGINMTFPITNPNITAYINYIWNNTAKFPSQNLTAILGGVLKCRFWNTTTSAWDSSGLTLVGLTNTSMICSTTHLTDFAIDFFNVGLSTLTDSNAGAIFEASNWLLVFQVPVYENIGFFVVLTIILLYIVALLYGRRKDKIEFEQMTYESILEEAEDTLKRLEEEEDKENKVYPVDESKNVKCVLDNNDTAKKLTLEPGAPFPINSNILINSNEACLTPNPVGKESTLPNSPENSPVKRVLVSQIQKQLKSYLTIKSKLTILVLKILQIVCNLHQEILIGRKMLLWSILLKQRITLR